MKSATSQNAAKVVELDIDQKFGVSLAIVDVVGKFELNWAMRVRGVRSNAQGTHRDRSVVDFMLENS